MTNIFTKWFGKKEIESKTFAELDKNAQELISASLVFTSDKGEALEIDSKGEFVAKEKKRMGRPSNKPYHTLGDIPNPNEGTKKRRGRPRKWNTVGENLKEKENVAGYEIKAYDAKIGKTEKFPGDFVLVKSTSDIMPVPASILSKEFITEAECKQFTKLTNKARKKLEDKEKFPRRLLIKAASRKFPFTYGHCYLGKAIEQWYENKHKKPVKPKIYKDPKPIYPKKNKHGGWNMIDGKTK